MKLQKHTRVKIFLQSASIIIYLRVGAVLCSHTIKNYVPKNSGFIHWVTVTFNFPNTANAIGALYFLGWFTGLILIVAITQATIQTIRDMQNPNFNPFLNEFKEN